MPRSSGLRTGCARVAVASVETRLRKPTSSGARAASGPPRANELRAAGRSGAIAHAQESEPMTQSTTRPTTSGTGRADPLTPRDGVGRIVRTNRSTAELYEDAVRAGEGLIAAEGPLVVRTGKHTGRSPQDKFIVKEPGSTSKIWWGPVNRPISEANYERLRARLLDYAASRDLYSQDCLIGAAPAHQRR